MYNYIYIYIYCYITPSISINIYVYRNYLNFLHPFIHFLKLPLNTTSHVPQKTSFIGISTSRLGHQSLRPRGLQRSHMFHKDPSQFRWPSRGTSPTKISERFQWVLGWISLGCFGPLAGHRMFFFILGTTKSRKFVLQVAKSFREKHSLWPWRVLNSVFQDSRLKSWLDLGEKMRRSDAWKGGYSIYKSGALQRCFYGSYMT